jgi:hypothetical protein
MLESMRLLCLTLLSSLGCGSVVANDVDATTSLDASAGDGAPLGNYCQGWTYCDSFDGDQSIGWSMLVAGTGATIAPSSVRSTSGAMSLRVHREAMRGENDGAIYTLAAPKLTECEYDIFVAPTFTAATPEVAVAFMKLRSSLFKYLSPATASFTTAGFIGRWGAQTNSSVQTDGITPVYTTQSRGQWLHVAMRYGYAEAKVASSDISIGALSGNPETKKFTFPNSFPYDTQEFQIGIYAGTSSQELEVFFDNVRCR